MKKKLNIFAPIIFIVFVVIFYYLNHGHRNIENESADFNPTIEALETEFLKDGVASGKKYSDKTIQLNGTITSVDLENKGIVLESKIFATFKEIDTERLKVGQKINIKGRFIGYDELLEEFKIDQIILMD